MYAFWSYWYAQSWQRFHGSCLSALESVEDEVAVIDTARNIGKPLFQDYSRQGRILGIAFRIGRIIAGLLAFSCVILGYVALYALWLLLPLLCIVAIAGSFLGR